MEKRTAIIQILVSTALLWAVAATHAQTGDVSAVASECGVTVLTNLSQLVVAVDNPGLTYPQIFPYDAGFDPWDTWFADFSQLPEGLAAIQNYPGQEQNGVVFFPLRVIQYADTGETVLQYPYYPVELLWLPSPPNYQPFQPYNEKLSSYCQQTGQNPTNYEALVAGGQWYLDPPRICMDLWVAPLACCAAFESNIEAQAEADAAAATTAQPVGSLAVNAMVTSGGMFMAMDDEDDGGDDPCTLTSLTQTFSVTNITRTANGISITFQSCQFFRYLIFTASQLSSNTVWLPQAYIWGIPGHSSTTWTDLSTTNNDGNTVTQRFYRVQRILGSPIAAGGGHSLAVTPDGKLWS
jgi:hypothetical protein